MKDPLKIIGKPNPKPAEREQAMALAAETGKPPKMCRAALRQANHDLRRARGLLKNKKFIRMNTELGELAVWMQRTQAAASGDDEASEEESRRYDEGKPARQAMHERTQAARSSTLDDPVFGTLKWDELWEGEVDVPPFGKVPVTIETDDAWTAIATPPGEAHRKALEGFRAVAPSLRPEIERANFDYFQRVRPMYAETFGEKHIANPATPADLWKELGQPSLHIPLQDGSDWRIEIDWSCSWDEEHGHAVYIRDGKVVSVDLQGEEEW